MGHQANLTNERFRESPEVATELERRFLQGPVGSFADDSPPRAHSRSPEEKGNPDNQRSPHPATYPNYRPVYNQSTAQHAGHSIYQENANTPWGYGPPPYSYYAPPQHPLAQPYHYPPYGYQPPITYPPNSSSYYKSPHSTSYDSSQPPIRRELSELSRSPIAPVDWMIPPEGIPLSDSFEVGTGDPVQKEPDRTSYDFFTSSEQKAYSSDSSVSTHEKKPGKRGGNPFRSPKPDDKMSSIYLQPSPNLSFNILDSPTMGPSFSHFDDTFDSSRLYSTSFEDESVKEKPDPKSKSDWKMASTSTFPTSSGNTTSLSYTKGFVRASPELHGVPRSPVQAASRTSEKMNTTQTTANTTPEKSSSKRRAPLRIRASPVAPSSEVKPRNLWQQPVGNSTRLTLGQVGTKLSTSAQQRTFDDINSMMRSQQKGWGTGTSHSSSGQQSYATIHSQSMHHGYYHAQTPYAPHQHSTPRRDTPVHSSRHHASMVYPPSAAATPTTATSVMKKHPPISTGGKENQDSTNPPTSSAQKKGACNCKKSKCLKLYCECFAARQYCDGCNCKDCHNTPKYEPEREKAINQALSKNRAAFDPRIADEHNMGCKCRRSQCLKKYCEVSTHGFSFSSITNCI